ncbi:hypothetical protein BY458DRAFT_533830 [Sporodiniella umbellata]|nr:hypothetical protein BY458DRAFT_533830 [Sporodiniella umbellata]
MKNRNFVYFSRLKPALGETGCIELFPVLDQLVARFSKASESCHTIRDLQSCTENILEAGCHFLESFQDEKRSLEDMCLAFENVFMEETYDIAFFKITQLLLDQDQMLSEILEDLEYLDYTQISLPNLREARAKVQHATGYFEKIGSLRSPICKLDCLLNTIEALTQEDCLSTDSLVPLFLMTMISSKLPHLLANLCYMKDFIFKTDISYGTYGYSLSTLEAVLNFIPHSNIHELSLNNQRLWASIQANDLASFEKYYNDMTALEPRDRQGNNVLLKACLEGQASLVQWILTRQDGVKLSDLNDRGMTPLMCAVQACSFPTVLLLLKDTQVRETLDALDKEGDSVLMYLGRTQATLEMLEAVFAHGTPSPCNARTGQTVLHLASHSPEFTQRLLHAFKGAEHWADSAGNTLYHVSRDPHWLKTAPVHALTRLNFQGQSPLWTWASEGRLDLLQLFPTLVVGADRSGRSVLHAIAARLPKGITGGLELIHRYRDQIKAQDWPDHNTPLHIALEQATPASIPLVLEFVQTLCCYGASLDFKNVKGERPVDLCHLPHLCQALDGKKKKCKHSIDYLSFFKVS